MSNPFPGKASGIRSVPRVCFQIKLRAPQFGAEASSPKSPRYQLPQNFSILSRFAYQSCHLFRSPLLGKMFPYLWIRKVFLLFSALKSDELGRVKEKWWKSLVTRGEKTSFCWWESFCCRCRFSTGLRQQKMPFASSDMVWCILHSPKTSSLTLFGCGMEEGGEGGRGGLKFKTFWASKKCSSEPDINVKEISFAFSLNKKS